MSITREITIHCDHDGCPDWSFVPYIQCSGLVASARIIAEKSAGWVSINDRDYCAKHVPAPNITDHPSEIYPPGTIGFTEHLCQVCNQALRQHTNHLISMP